MANRSATIIPRLINGISCRCGNDGVRIRTRYGYRAAVTDQVVAVITLARLDPNRLPRLWNYRPPAHAKEMGDEGFDIMHGPLLTRRSTAHSGWSDWYGTGGILFQALLDNPQALAHLLHSDKRTRSKQSPRSPPLGTLNSNWSYPEYGRFLRKSHASPQARSIRDGRTPIKRLSQGQSSRRPAFGP